METKFLGIVHVGYVGQGSYAYGDTQDEAASKAARIAKSDWKLTDPTAQVQMYDATDRDGWYVPIGTAYKLLDNNDKELPFIGHKQVDLKTFKVKS